ncbi:MAG: DegT/DnrJ/EryC1/StrS family aminotransferase [Deltaproteobacteria bacterium]|nr:DegT/DnrJ/EryC1/StrS family aminotransferase [Deltaproteobacteria bacterium]
MIVPAYTLAELLPLMRAHGLRPVAADIEPEGFNVDVKSVEAHITPNTKAILATHLFGAPCDIEALCALASARGLHVVEDCAHGLGATVNGRKAGTFGTAAFFSFEVNKALPTYGGGMVVTRMRAPARRWPRRSTAVRAWSGRR